MGRKTFESLPKKTLPGRVILVISRSDTDLGAQHQVKSLEEALDLAQRLYPDRLRWVAGGRGVYVEALSKGLVDRVLYTRIPEELPMDADTVQLPEDFLAGCKLVEEHQNDVDGSLWHAIYQSFGVT